MRIPSAEILNCEHTATEQIFPGFPKDTQKQTYTIFILLIARSIIPEEIWVFADVTPTNDIPNCPDSGLGVPENGRANHRVFTLCLPVIIKEMRLGTVYFSVRYNMPIDPIQIGIFAQMALR